MAARQEKGLLSECSIAFVPSSSLVPKDIAGFADIAQQHGAEILEPRRDGSIRLQDATHIVSHTIDFPQFKDSQAYMIPVVTNDWIASTIRRGRLAQVRPFSPDPRMIFSKVTITCADLPMTDKETIIGATLALGGLESPDVTRQTTHLCALSIDDARCVAALQKNAQIKIVLPHWFEDCFKLGKRIDETPYLLPDAEILRLDAKADVKIPANHDMEGAIVLNPSTIAQGPAEPSTIFNGKHVMISTDLNIGSKALQIVQQRIINGGGRIVTTVDDCDWFVCQFRDGPQYVRACQAGKEVGNLAWLLYLVSRNEWASPQHRLLHYPIPKGGIPGFKELRICISNYGGDARIYLENLIRASGATYTKTMKGDNTHLITARSSSEKYEAAKDWGIETVNHLWIEESYAKSEMQPVSVAKYTHFPPRTNLGEIIGQTFFNEQRLRELYYPGGEDSQSPASRRRRKILDTAQENSYKTGPAEGVVIGRQMQKDFDVHGDDDEEEEAVAARTKGASGVKTPARSKRTGAGKENETPSIMSTGGRSAKNKALDSLKRIAPDMALYEKEKKRHSKDGIWGGKRAADQIDRDRTRRSSDAARDDGDLDMSDAESERPAKRRRSSLTENPLRVMLTGFTRWVEAKHKEDTDRRKLRAMGIRIVSENQPCDYLCAPYMVRTVKFLRTLAKGVEVLSDEFIMEALKKGKVPDPDAHILVDKKNETKFGVELRTAISRARAHNGKLLRGVPIYCTSCIRNGLDSYRSIVEANGGQFIQYSARSGVTIKPTTAEEDNGAPPDPVYLLTSDSAEERKLWPKFIAMAEKGHMEPRVVVADWLLDVAMRQQVSYDADKYAAAAFFERLAARSNGKSQE
ncbi:BRCT-containing protein [Plectosphaerella plurivora]|uniref:BRCT-containing protein n=1 Tax=Plectosphaerella plurivora TaxID=936078 RepID=A0A9P8V6Y8_9PEZI|nr:BRCT-containing protein [Plectosphaerella plurivora]